MGWIHYLAYQQVEEAQLVGFSSRSESKRAGDWRGIQGNFGPPGEQITVTGMKTYAEFDALLADPDIDLIDICLPPDLHAEASIQALNAGKHVLVEKPMALSTDDCDRMVAAAQAADRQLLVAHVLPFFPEYAHARQLIASGEYGKLLGGHFKRVISDPQWIDDFFDPHKVGGPLVDLHVHDAHLIRMLLGMPQAVTSQGRMRGDVVEYCNTMFAFDDPAIAVSSSCGVVNQQGRSFTHGFEIHLERATMQYELAVFADQMELMPLKILTDDGQVVRPDLGDGDPVRAFEAEIQEVAASIDSGRPSSILSGALARDAIVLCDKQTEAVKSGGRVKV